jgi:hypothetical protein
VATFISQGTPQIHTSKKIRKLNKALEIELKMLRIKVPRAPK